MEAHALATLGIAGVPSWADASRVIHASGAGLVSHDVHSGCQTHLWGTVNKSLGGSSGVPVYAVCASRQLVAVAYTSPGCPVHIVSSTDFHDQALIRETSKESCWHALAISADGSRIAGVGSYPDHWLDIWDVDDMLQENKGKTSLSGGLPGTTSIAKVRLGPRLSTHTPVFFPLNARVLAVAGPEAVRVLLVENILGGHRMHQTDVDLATLLDGETLTSISWSATGALLIGTSHGRLLGVEGAAPTAIREVGWGVGGTALKATVLFTAPSKPITATQSTDFRPPSLEVPQGDDDLQKPSPGPGQLGAVVSVMVLPSHIALLYAGTPGRMEDSCPAHLLWLTANDQQMAALCPLPAEGRAEHACLSPGSDMIMVTTSAKELVLANAMFEAVAPEQDDASQVDQGGPTLGGAGVGRKSRHSRSPSMHLKSKGGVHKVQARVLASLHAGRVGGVIVLPNEMIASGGHDGRVRLWQCTMCVTAEGGLAPVENNNPNIPRFALSVTLVASWDVAAPITYLGGYLNGPLIVAGTSTGEVHIFNSSKVNILVGSGSLIHLPSVHEPMANANNAASAEIDDALAPVWAQRPFEKAVTSVAVSCDGHVCAMSSAAQGRIAFYRVVSISNACSEIALHLLGFYNITSPQLLAWGPKDSSAAHPHLLVVSTTNGELQIVRPPDSLGHLKHAGALVPTGSLLVGLLRSSSTITAMATASIQSTDDAAAAAAAAILHMTDAGTPSDAGTFWLFACCMDKSLKRFKLNTDQHKATARTALEAALQRQESITTGNLRRGSVTSGQHSGPITITAPQNFQTPDTERSQELSSPACHTSTSTTGKQLTVSTLCGTTYVYSLPDMMQLVRWPLHAPLPVEETTLAAPQAVYHGDKLVQAPPASLDMVYAKAGAASMSNRLLASVGVDGCMQVVELQIDDLVAGGGRAKPLSMTGRASPSANLRRAYAPLAPSARMSAPPGLSSIVAGSGAAPARPAYLTHMDALPRQVLTWQQAQAAMQAHTIAQELKAAQELVSKKKAVWQEQLKDLRARNEAAEGVEKLDAQEFVMDRALQAQLQAEGAERVAKVRAASLRACVEPEVIRARLVPELLSCTEPGGGHQILAPLPEHTFTSPMAAEDLKRWKEASTHAAATTSKGVTSYAVRALTPHEAAQLRKVTFLRRVEQIEQAEWPVDARGQVITIKRYKGAMAQRIDLSTLTAASSTQPSTQPTPRDATAAAVTGGGTQAATPAPGAGGGAAPPADEDDDMEEEDEDGVPRKKADSDNIEGSEIKNGLCGLLYAPLQLHCPTRKAAQAILLMEEIRATQRAFNARFEKLKSRKAADLDKLDERVARITEIQKELTGAPVLPCDFTGQDCEYWQDSLTVNDSEVKVDKWVSPEEAARRAAEAKAEGEARRKAEADDARQRALREMMNSTLEVRKVVKEDEALTREPWMDLPRTQLTAEQRKTLTEWEKRSAEVAEELEKARRALETERKGLEFEMADIIMEFNAQLAALAASKIKVGIDLRVLELQAVDCALSREGAAAANAALDDLRVNRAHAINAVEWRRALLAEAHGARTTTAREYEVLAGQERALDKAVKRELGLKDEEMWEVVQRIYKDRTRPCRSGGAGRTLADILGKLPEAANIVPQTPLHTLNHLRSFAGELLPQTCVLDPPPAEPPCSSHLQRWLTDVTTHSASRAGADAARIQDGAAAVDHILYRLTSNRDASASTTTLPAIHVQEAVDEGVQPGRTGIRAPSPASARAGQGTQPASRAASPALKNRPGTSGSMGPGVGFSVGMSDPDAGNGQGVGVGVLAQLTQLLGHRPLGALLDIVVEGRPLRSLMSTSINQGLAPPDAYTLQDPYQSPLAQTVFGPAGPLPTPNPSGSTPSSSAQTPLGGSPLPPRPTDDKGQGRKQSAQGGTGPYTLADKPADMEEVWWLRLMDMRDARIGLEQAADASWSQLAWASLLCDILTAEEKITAAELDDISEALNALPNVATRSLLDVMLLYRLNNGQLEVPCTGDDPLTAMQPATLLHRWQVEQRNLAIQESGGEKLGHLRDLKTLATDSHLARWGVSRGELRQQHAKAELSDLQLLHVTKDLQAVLRDRAALARMDVAAQMEARISAAAASHTARMALKVEQEARLTMRVAQCIREHRDLEGATAAAQAASEEAKRVRQVIARSAAEDEAAHKRALRAIVANSQLKDIAAAQAAELQALSMTLESLKTRTFPQLTPSMRNATPPDLRMPRTPSPSAPRGVSAMPGGATGGLRPYSVPAGKSRPMYGASRPGSGKEQVPTAGVAATLVRATSASRATAAAAGASAGLAALAGGAGTGPGALLPPRPGTVATGIRRYDRPSR